jgi:hypothetical protein
MLAREDQTGKHDRTLLENVSMDNICCVIFGNIGKACSTRLHTLYKFDFFFIYNIVCILKQYFKLMFRHMWIYFHFTGHPAFIINYTNTLFSVLYIYIQKFAGEK